ncbi:MAG: DUF370 domain-containing protein [Clostridia bacterium]|nr:DUF370 domain-containing protein [Clostridia bacterium]
MYLHLGQDVVVRMADVVGIFDMDNTTVSRHTRDFLAAAEQAGQVVSITYELPRSFVVCVENGRQTVYLCQLAPATLKKRLRAGMFPAL